MIYDEILIIDMAFLIHLHLVSNAFESPIKSKIFNFVFCD